MDECILSIEDQRSIFTQNVSQTAIFLCIDKSVIKNEKHLENKN